MAITTYTVTVDDVELRSATARDNAAHLDVYPLTEEAYLQAVLDAQAAWWRQQRLAETDALLLAAMRACLATGKPFRGRYDDKTGRVCIEEE